MDTDIFSDEIVFKNNIRALTHGSKNFKQFLFLKSMRTISTSECLQLPTNTLSYSLDKYEKSLATEQYCLAKYTPKCCSSSNSRYHPLTIAGKAYKKVIRSAESPRLHVSVCGLVSHHVETDSLRPSVKKMNNLFLSWRILHFFSHFKRIGTYINYSQEQTLEGTLMETDVFNFKMTNN